MKDIDAFNEYGNNKTTLKRLQSDITLHAKISMMCPLNGVVSSMIAHKLAGTGILSCICERSQSQWNEYCYCNL